jgi:hypothetical protein
MTSNIKIIGLMLSRDNINFLDDWFSLFSHQFDKIFVLDGSLQFRDESKRVFLKFDVDYSHDSDFLFHKKTDHSLRKVVFDKIKSFISHDRIANPLLEYWVVLCHPDEFFVEKFSDLIMKASQNNQDLIIFNALHNMPHRNDMKQFLLSNDYKDLNYFIHKKNCAFRENRIFKFSPELQYTHNHSLVIPHGLNRKNSNLFFGNYLHYKVPLLDVRLFDANSMISNISQWSSLSTHYPPGHVILTLDDFFLSEPSGKYKGQLLYDKRTPFPTSLRPIL